MEAAIKGVLSKLDPYSSYIGPRGVSAASRRRSRASSAASASRSRSTTGSSRCSARWSARRPIAPGIQAGDRIVKIEGEPTKGIDIDEAVRRSRGKPARRSRFTVRACAWTTSEETVTLKREMIHVDTVLGDRRKAERRLGLHARPDKRIGYIRLTAFSRDTASDLKKALDELIAAVCKGLILDLRFNPGGLLNSAVEISDICSGRRAIVSTKGRNHAGAASGKRRRRAPTKVFRWSCW